MTFFRLLLRNLFYHWRGNGAVLLGVAVGTAVLTGALLVGDSLRGSLRDLTEQQLGWVDTAMVGGRFVRQDLATEIKDGHLEPALILQGAASTVPPEGSGELPRRAGKITVLGVTGGFWSAAAPISGRYWALGGQAEGRARIPGYPPGAVLSAALANELRVKPGDTIALHVQKASGVPRETLLGRRDESSVLARLEFPVKVVLADYAPGGRFSLNPSPAAPRNVFLPLPLLQERLDLKGRANALLAAGGDVKALQGALKSQLTLDDWGLVLHTPQSRTDDLFSKLDKNGDGRLQRGEWRGHVAGTFAAAVARGGMTLPDTPTPASPTAPSGTGGDGVISRDAAAKFYREHRNYVSLESRQMMLEPAVGDAALKAANESGLRAAPTLVYLANTIAANGGEVPYAIVATLDPTEKPPLGPFLPPGADSLKDDEIILADWKESPLKVKPGDEVTLKYFEPVEGGLLREKEAKFRLAGLVPMQGPADDPDLTPEFPGITDKLSLAAWDPPFPYDNTRVKKRDEDYWNAHRTTPRAYVTLKKGQELWGSRFGRLTSIRLAPVDDEKMAEFQRRLLGHLNPEDGGLVFDPVRERALKASAGGNDFGGLFLGFSFFLIAAALLLVGLLFRLNLDRRASEIGLLMATGFRRRAVFWLLLAEGAILAAVGGVVGLVLAVGYSWLLLDLLRRLWPGGLEQSFLRPHVTAQSLAIGFVAAFLVSVGTIFWAVLALRKVPPRALLAGETTVADPATPRAARRWGVWVAVGFAVFGLALLPLGPFVHDSEMRAMTFFGSGFLLLIAALAGAWAWMRSTRHGHVGGHGGAALARLGVRNAARHPVRSLLTAGLLAAAAFLLVAVESFRRSAGDDFLARDAGSGGYALVADSDVPVYQDLNGDKGRAEISDALERRLRDPESLKKARAALGGVTFQQFRVRAGDDASCLNLYQPRKPRLLGVPPSLVNSGGFRFADTSATTPEERQNPWLLLDRGLDDGALPVIGEANTVKWMLKSDIGKDIAVTDERGNPVKLRVVALLSDSVFQSGLLMSEKNFLKLYPSSEGYNFFLIETTPGRADEAKRVLETALGDRGFEVTPSARRLEAYLAVENMYLSTFQALGGLGLLLGTLGLAVVLLRSVWERRGELALLRALGYRHRALGWLLLSENGFLLLLGLGIGAATALLAVAPHLIGGAGAIPWPELLGMLAAVLLVGLLVAAAALAATLRAPLVPALRRE
jgi:ABC-type antimicrobial peptide transport system permease subunit